MGRNKEFGHVIGRDKFLQFPKITKKSLEKVEGENIKVTKELEVFLKSCKFSKKRIAELEKLKQDMEDLKKLDRVDRKKGMLEFLKEQKEEINIEKAKLNNQEEK